MKNILIKGIVFSCLAMLGGCAGDALKSGLASVMKLDPAKVWLEQVKFNPSEDVNSNSPVTVDILVFYDAESMKKVAALTADKYFSQKDQLQKDYGDQIDFFSYEVVPGQKMKDQDVNLSKSTGLAAVAFGRYSTPGPHRVAIGGDRVIQLDLEKNDFKITTIKP